VIDLAAERALFATLLLGNLDEFQAQLARETRVKPNARSP
jgi:hypothetical protein